MLSLGLALFLSLSTAVYGNDDAGPACSNQKSDEKIEIVCRNEDKEKWEKIAQTEQKKKWACPNVTEDAKILLTSLKTLEDEFRKSPECQSVLEKVQVISNITTKAKWKNVLNLFNQGQNPASLEPDEVQEIAQYSTEAAVALADTIALLNGSSNHCLPKEKKASLLGTLSTVTKEVSTVVGSIAGPTGAGVAMVGNMLASAISGIDSLFKSGKIYNFKRPEERLLFMNQFCAYTEAQQDINDYILLSDRKHELQEMDECYLKPKIEDLTTNCEECKYYELAAKTHFEANKLIQGIIEDASIIAMGDADLNKTSFSRCGEINRAFHTETSDLYKYVELLKKYNDPEVDTGMNRSDRGTITDFTDAYDALKETFPKYSECVSMKDSGDIRRISLRFNDFIRDEVISYHNKLFSQQMRNFLQQADRKYKKTLGSGIAKSLELKRWVAAELRKVDSKLEDANFCKSVEVVQIQQNTLRDRITGNLMPEYLKHMFKDTRKRIAKFEKDFQKTQSEIIRHYSVRLKKSFDSLKELTDAAKNDPAVAKELVSAFDRNVRNASIIMIRELENKRFCEYLGYSISLVPENRNICNDGISAVERALIKHAEFNQDMKVVRDFNSWAKANLNIQSTEVQNYNQKISEWRSQGDARWEEQ